MNRLIICTILLLIGHAAFAETLYRWIEPDGSITFSPTKPPSGVDFKTVNAANSGAGTSELPANAATKQPSILATSQHDLNQRQAPVVAAETMTPPAAALSQQRLSYAPETDSVPRNTIKANATQPTQPPTSRGQTIVSSNKQKQCQDLSKRVLSLERRLRSKLAAEDMDNTVIAMARYQRSFDQHCVG